LWQWRLALASLDLTAAFDVVDRNLLRKHLKIMGIPVQLIHLLNDWISDRSAYCEVNKNNSEFSVKFKGQFCALCYLPCLSQLLQTLLRWKTYADDNYLFGSREREKKVLENCIKETEIAMKWFLNSGLGVNKKKRLKFVSFIETIPELDKLSWDLRKSVSSKKWKYLD
jgi:hypothetical protein